MPLPPLPKLQQQFLEYIYTDQDSAPILDHIAPQHNVSAAGRMGIYRTATRLILIDLLANTFPVTRRLVSTPFFRQVAEQFILQNPPQQGDMGTYGQQFPAFLRGLSSLQEHPYVAAIAHLEWLREEAYHAAQSTPLDPSLWEGLNEAQLGEQILSLRPCVRLLSSPYPVMTLWETFREHDPGTTPNLDTGAEYVLIHRPEHLIQLTQITQQAHDFLQQCQKGVTLADGLANISAQTATNLLSTLLPLNIFNQPQ